MAEIALASLAVFGIIIFFCADRRPQTPLKRRWPLLAGALLAIGSLIAISILHPEVINWQQLISGGKR